jgi:hypothetical protein
MADRSFSNRGLVTVGFVICLVSILVTPRPGVCATQDDEEVSQQQPNEGPDIEELQMRADTEVKEVNEAISAEIAQAEAVRRNRYQEELGYIPTGKLLSDEELAAFEKERAEKEKAIRAKIDYDIKSMEQQQAGGEQQVQTTKSQRATVRSRTPAAKPVRGLVTGIVYYENKGAALVDGEVVRENDTVLDVKVVKILPDYVEFEKQGKKWKQLVGQTPPANWAQQPSPVKQSSADSNSKSGPGPKPKTSKK